MPQTNATKVLDKLFSSEIFKDIDTIALVKQYDISATLRQTITVIVAQVPVVPSTNSIVTTITSIPPEGLLINQSGQYEFSNDIVWSPAVPCTAITITASDVFLDFKGFALSANIQGQNMAGQYNGISITGCNAVNVKSGNITGVSYRGIEVSNAANIQIMDMKIGNMHYIETTKGYITPCGIFMDGTVGFGIMNCTVHDIRVTAPSCAGIQLIESSNGIVWGCTMRHFLNNDGGVQGFSYLLCSGINTIACKSEGFQSHYLGKTVTSGHTVIGYVPIFCVDLNFTDCSATGMTGCCDDCHGMSIFLDAFVNVTNFKAKDVVDGITPRNTGAKATGLEVYGVSVVVSYCTSENIKAIVPQDLQSAGFSAWGDSILFVNCVATNVIVTDARHVPSTQYGYGTGFGWAPDPRDEFKGQAANFVQYQGCVSNNCQLGFDTWFHTNSKWLGVTTNDCPIFVLAEPSGATRTLSMDKCSESPDGTYQQVTISNIAANNVYPELGLPIS